MQNEEQEKMEFDEPEKTDGNWYVPLNRNNLIAVLAGGLITPHQCYTEYEEDLQRFGGDGVLLIRSGISAGVNENEDLTGSSGFTVLAEVSVTDYPKSKIRGLNEQGKTCQASIASTTGKARVISFPGIIPVTRVTAIHFKSDTDKKNFTVRGFDNVPTNIIPFNVSEHLFHQEVSELVIEGMKIFSGTQPEINNTALQTLCRQSDSFAGTAILLAATFPPEESWLNLLKKTLMTKQAGSIPDVEADQIITDKLEIDLFRSAYSMFMNMDPEDGWQAKKVLSDLHEAVNKDALSKDELMQLEKWQHTCEEILDNKRSITPLTDSRMKVGRALLLLFLRPDPDDVLNAAHSSLEPGLEVLSLAAMLAGARFGFEALSNSIKASPVHYNLFSNLKADLINKNWNKSLLKKISDIPVITTREKASGLMGQSFSIFANSEILAEKKNLGSLELRTVLDKAEVSGIKLKYERKQHRLSYRYDFKNGRTQTVYVSVGEENEHHDRTIRFWSPCLDLSEVKGRKLFNAAMSKTLLEKNCEIHIYCRFAYCKKEKAILVLHDQILDTMDQKELSSGLEHVAITADNFENELGQDIY